MENKLNHDISLDELSKRLDKSMEQPYLPPVMKALIAIVQRLAEKEIERGDETQRNRAAMNSYLTKPGNELQQD